MNSREFERLKIKRYGQRAKVVSKGLYGRLRLRVMGSWLCMLLIPLSVDHKFHVTDIFFLERRIPENDAM